MSKGGRVNRIQPFAQPRNPSDGCNIRPRPNRRNA
jgi:hypothetical protein